MVASATPRFRAALTPFRDACRAILTRGSRKTRHDAGQIVGRRIVDDDDAQIYVTLPQNACQRQAQEIGTVPSWNDDGDRFHARANITATDVPRAPINWFTHVAAMLDPEPESAALKLRG